MLVWSIDEEDAKMLPDIPSHIDNNSLFGPSVKASVQIFFNIDQVIGYQVLSPLRSRKQEAKERCSPRTHNVGLKFRAIFSNPHNFTRCLNAVGSRYPFNRHQVPHFFFEILLILFDSHRLLFILFTLFFAVFILWVTLLIPSLLFPFCPSGYL